MASLHSARHTPEGPELAAWLHLTFLDAHSVWTIRPTNARFSFSCHGKGDKFSWVGDGPKSLKSFGLMRFINPDGQNCAILGCGGILCSVGVFITSLVSAHQIPGIPPPSLAVTTKNVSRQSNVMGHSHLVVNP